MDPFVNLLDQLNQLLSPVSNLLGVVTFIPVLFIWWDITFGRRRRHADWFKQVRVSAGERPAVLVVDLHEKFNIRTSVEAYIKSVPHLAGVASDRVFQIERTKWLTPEDIPALITEIQETAGEIVRAGTDTLHLFYAGPVIPTAFIGAIFANACKVTLYQHTPNGTYVNWGPLKHNYESP